MISLLIGEWNGFAALMYPSAARRVRARVISPVMMQSGLPGQPESRHGRVEAQGEQQPPSEVEILAERIKKLAEQLGLSAEPDPLIPSYAAAAAPPPPRRPVATMPPPPGVLFGALPPYIAGGWPLSSGMYQGQFGPIPPPPPYPGCFMIPPYLPLPSQGLAPQPLQSSDPTRVDSGRANVSLPSQAAGGQSISQPPPPSDTGGGGSGQQPSGGEAAPHPPSAALSTSLAGPPPPLSHGIRHAEDRLRRSAGEGDGQPPVQPPTQQPPPSATGREGSGQQPSGGETAPQTQGIRHAEGRLQRPPGDDRPPPDQAPTQRSPPPVTGRERDAQQPSGREERTAPTSAVPATSLAGAPPLLSLSAGYSGLLLSPPFFPSVGPYLPFQAAPVPCRVPAQAVRIELPPERVSIQLEELEFFARGSGLTVEQVLALLDSITQPTTRRRLAFAQLGPYQQVAATQAYALAQVPIHRADATRRRGRRAPNQPVVPVIVARSAQGIPQLVVAPPNAHLAVMEIVPARQSRPVVVPHPPANPPTSIIPSGADPVPRAQIQTHIGIEEANKKIVEGLISSFALQQGLNPQVLKALQARLMALVMRINRGPIRALLNFIAHLELVAAQRDGAVVQLESLMQTCPWENPSALDPINRELFEGLLARLAHQGHLYPTVSLAVQRTARIQEAAQLRVLKHPDMLLRRVRQLNAFAQRAEQRGKLHHLLTLAYLATKLEADVNSLIAGEYREADFLEKLKKSASEEEREKLSAAQLQAKYPKEAEAARETAQATFRQSLFQPLSKGLIIVDVEGKAKEATKEDIQEFVDELLPFMKELAIPPYGVIELAHLTARLRPKRGEEEPTEHTIKDNEALPLAGPQRAFRDFYPVDARPPLTGIARWPLSVRRPRKGRPVVMLSRPPKWPQHSSCFLQPYATVLSTREGGVEYDYFHIGLGLQFTPDPLLDQRDARALEKIAILVSSFDMGASPVYRRKGPDNSWHKIGDNPSVSHCVQTMDNWSPIAKAGETKRTTTTGMTVEGSITQSGMEPGGSMTVSFSLEHATERTDKDVSIFPHIGYRGNVWWRFTYDNLRSIPSRGNDCARSTITPFVQWVWQIQRDAAELLLYTPTPASEPPLRTTSGYYFNFDFFLRAGLREVFTVPVIDKTIKSQELPIEIARGVLDGNIISLPVPPRLPPGRHTKQVCLIRTIKGPYDPNGGDKKDDS